MVDVFREVRRVLRKDGTCWLNLGDSYASGTAWAGTDAERSREGLARRARRRNDCTAHGQRTRAVLPGLKPKDLVGIPWRVAFALQADGWYLRSDIVWSKPNPMPESVTDRPTKAHEYVFLLTKSPRYFFDQEAVREDAVFGDSRCERHVRARRELESCSAVELEAGARADRQGQRLQQAATFAPSGRSPPSPTPKRTSPPSRWSWCGAASWRARLSGGAVRSAARRGCGRRRRCTSRSSIRAASKRQSVSRSSHISASLTRRKSVPTIVGVRSRTKEIEAQTGWRPSCSCGGAQLPIPATICDPFSARAPQDCRPQARTAHDRDRAFPVTASWPHGGGPVVAARRGPIAMTWLLVVLVGLLVITLVIAMRRSR